MKVIPVIDVLNGIAVHAIRGRRKEYLPLSSILVESVYPFEGACRFRALGFRELYMADLDSIRGGQTNYQLFKRIANETKLNLMIDAGVSHPKSAQKLLDNLVSKVVIGTETLTDVRFVGQAVNMFGSSHIVISLDLMGDRLLGKLGYDEGKKPMDILREFEGMGVSQVIILDLARVGSNEGVNFDFLRKVTEDFPFDVYVGGGVRGIDDLIELKNLGVKGALVASALHSGKIIVSELKQAGFL